jgi:hypothetical protein
VKMKTSTNDDKLGNAFGVANTLVDVPSATNCIDALEGPAIDKICLHDSLTLSSSIDFNIIQDGQCGQLS